MRKTVRRTRRAGRRRVVHGVSAVIAATLVLAGCLTGCDAGGGDGGDSHTEPTSAPTEPAVTTRVSFGHVAGRLPAAARHRLADDVAAVVDGWLDAAYVGGEYPRSDFSDSWPGFTAGAAAQARRDADLMSNRGLGARIDGVDPVGRAVRLDVLAVGRRPAGVTAHVTLRFDTTGDRAERVKVAGRLFLTEGKRGWQVFGYDMSKGVVR